jgi:hypothetical protein
VYIVKPLAANIHTYVAFINRYKQFSPPKLYILTSGGKGMSIYLEFVLCSNIFYLVLKNEMISTLIRGKYLWLNNE